MYPIYCGHDLVKHYLADGSLRLTCTKCPAVSLWHHSDIPMQIMLGPWITGFSETDPNKREEKVVGVRDDVLKKGLVEQIADYIATNNRYTDMDKREAIMEAVGVLTNDIGAAQRYMQAIGVDIDLYEYDFGKKKARIKVVNDPESMVEFMKNLLRVEVEGE